MLALVGNDDSAAVGDLELLDDVTIQAIGPAPISASGDASAHRRLEFHMDRRAGTAGLLAGAVD